MRDTIIETACIIGLLAWASGTFAQETPTSRIIEVGEPAPQLMPQYETTSSRITFENQGQTLRGCTRSYSMLRVSASVGS